MTFALMAVIGMISQLFVNSLAMLPLLFLCFSDVKYCSTSNYVVIVEFLTSIDHTTKWRNNVPHGIIFGCHEPVRFAWGFIPINLDQCFYAGFVDLDSRNLTLIASTSFLVKHRLFVKDACVVVPKIEIPPEYSVKYFLRDGNYASLYYSAVTFSLKFAPKAHQQKAIDCIESHFNEHGTTSVLLHGPTGTGKSLIPVFLAKKLGAALVKDFNPTEPGDSLIRLFHRTKSRPTDKLVIVLEEIDIILDKVHKGLIRPHLEIPILVKNKSEWNSFMDGFDRRFYPNVMLIMTTNKSVAYFDDMDSSYLRKGRVDMKLFIDAE